MKAPLEAPRFFTVQALTTGQELELEPDLARHILSALRLKSGATIRLFNGEGGEYIATILNAGRRDLRVGIGQFHNIDRESPLETTLGLCISRGDRMDYALQKSTELGVSRVIPLFSERSEGKLQGERLSKKQRHWQQVMISACEQCGRNRLPTLNTAMNLADWAPQADADTRFVLHHRGQQSLTPNDEQPKHVALLIGPEGGLSETEISLAEQQGFMPLTLGPRVMRTETAPVAILSLMQYEWGDFR